MTIKQLKELIKRVEEAGVPETTEVYSEQEHTNDTDCFLIVKKDEEVKFVYITDSSPDQLRDDLEDSDYETEIIY